MQVAPCNIQLEDVLLCISINPSTDISLYVYKSLHKRFPYTHDFLETNPSPAGEATRMADATTLLSLGDSVHIVLIKTESSGESILIASHYLEWRSVLAAPNTRCSLAVELMGIGVYWLVDL